MGSFDSIVRLIRSAFLIALSPLLVAPVAAQDSECPASPPSARASAAAPRRSLLFEVPHPLEEVRVPGALEALGVPVKLRAVKSSSSSAELIAYFRTTFTRAGLFVVPEPFDANPGWGPQVTGYDPDTRISYTAVLQPNRDKTTTVLLGKAYVGDRKEAPPDESIAPLFPGATETLTSNLEAARSLSYSVKAKPEDVARFYRDVLVQNGYREIEAGVFQRKQEVLRIQLSERKPDPLHVLVLAQGAASGDMSAPEPVSAGEEPQ